MEDKKITKDGEKKETKKKTTKTATKTTKTTKRTTEKKEVKEKKEIKNNEEEIDDNLIIGINEKGEKQTFYKLLEFDSTDDGLHYVAYTDYSTDENGNYKAYGSVVTMENGEIKLGPIENEKAWNFIEITLKTIQNNKNNE